MSAVSVGDVISAPVLAARYNLSTSLDILLSNTACCITFVIEARAEALSSSAFRAQAACSSLNIPALVLQYLQIPISLSFQGGSPKANKGRVQNLAMVRRNSARDLGS